MDLATICQVLQATQQSDETLRKAAEEKLEEAKTNTPDQLVQALVSVLAGGSQVPKEIRQQAAVLLRQRVDGGDFPEGLNPDTCKALRAQALLTVQNDPDMSVQRSAGSLVTSMTEDCKSMEEVKTSWPELLPWLAQAAESCNENASSRVVALQVLKGLVPSMGSEMLTDHAAQFKALLSHALPDSKPEVRAAGAQLVLSFIEHSETDLLEQLADAMPAVNGVLQGLATGSTEKELEETLEGIQEAAEAEGEFFFKYNFEPLWTTLMTIVKAGPETFAAVEVRHSAMECIMNITKGNCDDDAFKPYLEGVVEVNFLWMLQVEEDVAVWTAEGKKDEEDDDCDDDNVRIGEENFDILGETYDEEDIMPVINKVCTAATANQDWKSLRASIMCMYQVLEHLEDDTRVDQCIDYMVRLLENPHPRVRYTAWAAISQAANDQSERFEEKYAEDLIPKVIRGLQDDNFRVVNAATEAFGSFAAELDFDQLEEHLKELLTLLFKNIDGGASRSLQENSIEVIANIADACEDDFAPYYGQVMPLIKQIIGSATRDDQRTLRGKAFNCASVLGTQVGKEHFMTDACEIMSVMVPLFQAGFAADDELREYVHEAAGNIVSVIGKDFKPYVQALLPSIFEVLKQSPKDICEMYASGDFDGEDGDDLCLNDIGTMGLKVGVTREMDEVLVLLLTLAEQLEEEFSDFIAASVETLLPMLDYPLPEDVRLTLSKTWGRLAKCAREGVQHGKLSANVRSVLATEFLKKTVGLIGKVEAADVCETNLSTCSNMQALAVGASNVIENCGEGVLTRDAVKDIARVIGQLVATIVPSPESAAGGKKKKKQAEVTMDDEDFFDMEGEDDDVTPHTVRLALVDVMCKLLRTNQEDFIAEVLPTFMNQLCAKLVQPNCSDPDQCLGFYIADGVSEVLGPRGVAYWQVFMNQALIAAGNEKKPVVQRFALNVVGTGARQKESSVMATAACQTMYTLLEKHGAKHKRRRVKPDQNPAALSIDAGVRALGLMLEHHEQALGEHAPRAWNMWLASLPIKYDVEAGKQVHLQLLSLLAREHPALVDGANLPLVLKTLTDVYRSKFSTKQLDKDIAFAFEKIGPEKLEVLCSGFKEDSQKMFKKKTEQMLKSAKAVGGA